jgi:hypothetical protein
MKDVPPLEIRVKRGDFIIKHGRARVKYDRNIDKYVSNGSITLEQYEAGLRLWQDAMMAGIECAIRSPILEERVPSKNNDITDNRNQARERFNKIFFNEDEKIDEKLKEVLWDIVIFDYSLSYHERNMRYYRGYGIKLLVKALNYIVKLKL